MKYSKLILTALLLVLFGTQIFAVPVKAASPTSPVEPAISGKAAITIDVSTGEIIYAKNIDKRVYPASTTKLMTALLFSENKKESDLIKYTADAAKQPSSSLKVDKLPGLAVGDTMTAGDVMKALLLPSANDAAYMIADSVGKNSADFINMMNDKAKEMNLKNTHFVTANGLHDDNHYTTAYDLSIIARASFNVPWIKSVMGTKKAVVDTTSGLKAEIENTNKLLGVDGCIGGKTGFTDEAGRCLVAFYERNGREIMGIVMDDVNDSADTMSFKDMETIINWSYSAVPSKLYAKGQVIKKETVSYKPFRYFGPEMTMDIPVVISSDVEFYKNDINENELKESVKLTSIDPWTLKASDKVGTLNIQEREANISYNLITTASSQDFIRNSINVYIIAFSTLISILILAAIIMVLIIRRRSDINIGS